ncbi:MAG: 3-dehydroquinate synthase [Bacillota bacterium]|nr:3-dehydroquinate synthase [Bacillota bacterium]
MIKKIEINVSQKYDYFIERGSLDNIGNMLKDRFGQCSIIVVSDDAVDSVYGNRVAVSLTKAGFNTLSYVFERGEKSKNFFVLNDLLEFMAENYITKKDILLSLGGGTVGDVSGFAASVYSRGIRYVQIPTTFLAAIDSAVGGKTAVNLKAGKNLAGSIYHPSMVICDPDTFDTLEPEVYAQGTAEAVKCGIIGDKRIFSRLSKATFKNNIEDIIESCVKIKMSIVELDENDNGKRQLLNLGHTFAHSIEKCSMYKISHGSAVAMGILMAARAGAARGYCKRDLCDKINAALIRNGLHTKCRLSLEKIAEGMLSDKKRRGDTINMVFPRKIGKCEIVTVPVDEIPQIVRDATESVNDDVMNNKNRENSPGEVEMDNLKDAPVQRVLLAAALSDRETIFKLSGSGEDTDTMAGCLRELGAETEIRSGNLCKVTPICMNKAKDSGGFLPIINCRENSTALRLLVPVMAALKKEVFVSGTGELAKTPFTDMIEAMEPMGSVFRFDHFPFELSGELRPGEFRFGKDVSEEFLSGLLMALPVLEGDSKIEIEEEPDSFEYADKTIRVLREFGITVERNSCTFVVKGNQKYVSPAGFEIYDLI